MLNTAIVFPHQLFEDNPLFKTCQHFVLIEECLYFQQYPFHKQKIAFHRATMQFYRDYLISKGYTVDYIDSTQKNADIREFLKETQIKNLHWIAVEDDWLNQRLQQGCEKYGITTKILPSPMFLNTPEELSTFFKPEKKKFHQTTFYKQQRKSRQILMDGDKPVGGKWTYDAENRKKYPKAKQPPVVHFPSGNRYTQEAIEYVNNHFRNHYGTLTVSPFYPTTFEQAKEWLDAFLTTRFHEFGVYEDAIVQEEIILNHSILSPLMNCGLLTPMYVLEQSLKFAEKHNVPINSVEGFVRQIIGWREFIRGMYHFKGVEQRNGNFWNFTNPLPASFYDGTTGILPVDKAIQKVLKTGYCHHIERLMILSNFMVLCEIHPKAVYQWFMEMFIDAYDWVMVPNVYGMSLFADGGLMSTKPYISSSNYILKMSDYKKAPWTDTWDALFWRFMHVHREFFASNPRLGLLLKTLDKMPDQKRNQYLDTANTFLEGMKG